MNVLRTRLRWRIFCRASLHFLSKHLERTADLTIAFSRVLTTPAVVRGLFGSLSIESIPISFTRRPFGTLIRLETKREFPR